MRGVNTSTTPPRRQMLSTPFLRINPRFLIGDIMETREDIGEFYWDRSGKKQCLYAIGITFMEANSCVTSDRYTIMVAGSTHFL